MPRWCWIGWVLLVFVGSGPVALAQEAPPDERWGVHRDTIDAFRPPPYRLRAFILPGSETLYLNDTRLDTTAYRIDYRTGRLWVQQDRLVTDATLVAIYRTFPFRFDAVYRQRRLDDSLATADTGAASVVEEPTEAGRPDSLEGLRLERSGSISRGLIGGSNRDATIESGLRMQLDGEVAEGVHVQAALTDANTPIQPEGTTQRLRDFDRVFLQIDAAPGTAQLGDIEVDFDRSTFGRFTRKLQGARLATADLGGAAPGLTGGRVEVVGATTRGRFRRQDIAPLDGVQGPYRLEGNEGERFIVVIAGSERVYLDGERLTRGETNDYVIDYAQAEITFTSERLITEDQRITVEFEYTATGFNRTLVGTEAEVGFGRRAEGEPRFALGATFLREADGRTFSSAYDLSPEDSLLLERAGDAGAVRSGATPVDFDPEAPYVQYRRTVQAGDTVFAALDAAPADSATVYRVRFSHVGAGQGSYARVGRSVNGIVYEYRGEGQGAYAPVQRLPQPVQQRLVDLRGQGTLLPHVEIFGEWARSFYDENRFSSLDGADDRGAAYRAGARLRPVPIELGARTLGTLAGEVQRHQTGRHFTAFNRTHEVEFGRRWNLAARGVDPAALRERGDEVRDEGQLALAFSPSSHLEGEAGRLTLGPSFAARRWQAALQIDEARAPRLRYRAERITSDDMREALDGTWLRHRGRVHQPFGRWVPRVEVEREVRRQRVAGTDSLMRASFAFWEVRPGLGYAAGALEGHAEVEYRTEHEGRTGVLRDASEAWTVQSDLAYRPSEAAQVQARVGYRSRRFTDYFRRNAGREDRASALLRLRGEVRPFDRALDLEGFYDARTERTPTLQEIYVRTGPELGQYVWTDANGDGIVQVDEFVPETTPNEGAYVQRFVPSDSLTPVVNVQARLRLRADPARRWQSASAQWKRALAAVTTRTTVEVQEKSRASDLTALYLLDQRHFRRTGTTLDGQVRVGQDVYLFRRASRYGLDLSFDRMRGLSERTAGRQSRSRSTWRGEGRYRFGPAWSAEVAGVHARDRADSEAFAATRSYDIESIEVRPDLTFRPGAALRFTGGFRYGYKQDAIGPRSARLLKIPFEVRFTQTNRFELTGRVERADIRLDGEATGLAQFELTDGRGPGTSYLWRLSGQYRFSELLRATFSYDGRAPSEAPTVNTFRVQMSANF